MKQIYYFDSIAPPVLNEKALLAELERRKTQRLAAMTALTSILLNWCLIIAAIVLYPSNTFLSMACITYVCAVLCGGGTIAAIFIAQRNKRRELAWQQPQYLYPSS